MPLRALLITAVSLVVVGVGLATPSTAESGFYGGSLAVRGPGSVYSGSSQPSGAEGDAAFVSLAVGAGAIATYGIQVHNTGTELTQYRVLIESADGPPRKTDLLAGSLLLSRLASSPEGYFTDPIAPGKSQTLTLKVTVPAGTPQATLRTNVHLRAINGSAFDTAWIYTEIKAPASGPHAVDIFARQGSQPFVGGTEEAQVATAPAVKIGGIATFNVKLQNNRAVAKYVAAAIPGAPECATLTVKDGSVDVTASIVGNVYLTPPVKPGGFRNLTVTMKRIAGPCSRWTGVGMSVIDVDHPHPAPAYSVGMLVPFAYA